MEKAIEFVDVTKKYKGFSMEHINTSIPKGIASVLIGSNGAGKTTLLKMISGILLHEGKIQYDGVCVDRDSVDFKENMVFVPDSCCFFDFLDIKRVNEIMKLGFKQYDEQRFIALCNEFELIQGSALTSKKIKDMSTGNQMKLMLCAMLARNAKYILLDEPAANLDPVMQDLLQEKMRDFLRDEQHTIIYSTHNIEQVNNVADYAIFMKEGTIIEQGYILELQEKYRILRGDIKQQDALCSKMLYVNSTKETFEGLAYTKDIALLADTLDVAIETPSLRELSILLLKKVL